MATASRLDRASPRHSGTPFGHGFLGRFILVGGGTALLLLLGVVATAGPLPSWTGVMGAVGGISLLVGHTAEKFVDTGVETM